MDDKSMLPVLSPSRESTARWLGVVKSTSNVKRTYKGAEKCFGERASGREREQKRERGGELERIC